MKAPLIILISVFCSISFLGNAQLSLGLKSGYTNAWEYYGEVELPDDARTDIDGYNIYLLASWKINNFLEVAIEPGFIKRGAACVPGWSPIFVGDTKFELSYIDAPIFLQGNIPLINNKLKLYGKGGYGLAYMIRAIQVIESLEKGQLIDRSEVSFSAFNRLDHGIHGAAGIAYTLEKSEIFFETAIYYGMRNAELNNISKNRNLNLNIGYKINI